MKHLRRLVPWPYRLRRLWRLVTDIAELSVLPAAFLALAALAFWGWPAWWAMVLAAMVAGPVVLVGGLLLMFRLEKEED